GDGGGLGETEAVEGLERQAARKEPGRRPGNGQQDLLAGQPAAPDPPGAGLRRQAPGQVGVPAQPAPQGRAGRVLPRPPRGRDRRGRGGRGGDEARRAEGQGAGEAGPGRVRRDDGPAAGQRREGPGGREALLKAVSKCVTDKLPLTDLDYLLRT